MYYRHYKGITIVPQQYMVQRYNRGDHRPIVLSFFFVCFVCVFLLKAPSLSVTLQRQETMNGVCKLLFGESREVSCTQLLVAGGGDSDAEFSLFRLSCLVLSCVDSVVKGRTLFGRGDWLPLTRYSTLVIVVGCCSVRDWYNYGSRGSLDTVGARYITYNAGERSLGTGTGRIIQR